MRFLLRFALNAVALAITFQLVELCWDGTTIQLIIVAAIFGLVNALVRPIIMLLSCPLIILTLGLFVFVINVLMLWLTIWLADTFGLGFSCVPDFFWNLIIGAAVLTVVSWATNLLLADKNEKK